MKLWRPFKWDKANHALYGAAIYVGLRIISLLLGDVVPNYLCLAITAIVGLGLEVYQGLSKTGTPDFKDYLAVLLPALALYVLELILF